jgi:hypothetical protein
MNQQFINTSLDLLCLTQLSAISWRPVLVVEEAEVPGENQRPRAMLKLKVTNDNSGQV